METRPVVIYCVLSPDLRTIWNSDKFCVDVGYSWLAGIWVSNRFESLGYDTDLANQHVLHVLQCPFHSSSTTIWRLGRQAIVLHGLVHWDALVDVFHSGGMLRNDLWSVFLFLQTHLDDDIV